MAAPSDRRPLRHIAGLDGLRAIAVVGVMLFHGGVSWVPGGFLGVDVFFVLSGYLITTLLLRERVGTGGIDLRQFWTRRLRRLLPALLLLLAAVAIATPFLVEPQERVSVRLDGLASLLYVANWRFIFSEQSYFSGTASPLRHLWSLSVEEQWYIVFPVVVGLALRRARHISWLLTGLVVATVASAVWMAVLASGPVDPFRAYYGTDTRAHSLLVGSILAVVAAQWPLHRYRRTLSAAGVMGAVGIVGAYALVSEFDAFMYRGGFLLLALMSAGVVAAVALPRPALPLTRVLEVRPLVVIGTVSYGLYLWHWPVNVFLTPERTGLDGTGWVESVSLFALRTAVTVAFTVVSYRLVEMPVRREGVAGLRLRLPGLRTPTLTAAGLAALVVWLLFAGTLRVPEGEAAAAGLPASLAGAQAGVPEITGPPPATIPDEIRAVVESTGIPAVPEDRPVNVLVVGDSVAWTLSVPSPNPPESLVVRSRAILGCGTVDGFAVINGRIDTSAENCGDWPAYWQSGVAELPPDVVMFQFGAWEVYDHLVDGRTVESGTPEMRDEIRAGLDRGVEALLAVKPDVRFAIIGTPCMRERNPRLGGRESERNDKERVAWVNGVFEDYAEDLGDRATYIDLGELLCPDGQYRDEIDGVEVRRDGSHYAEDATAPVWAWLADRLVPFARTPVEGQDPPA